MKLFDLISGVDVESSSGTLDVDVTNIAFDSRDVRKNGLFVAITGFATDGHKYIDKAIENGAAVVVVETPVKVNSSITVIQTKNSRSALAGIASNFYNNPTEKMNMVGITGTNGKTSITYFVKSILDHQSISTGVIGTIGTLINDRRIETPNTTPESLTLQKVCSEMVSEGVKYCVMEVSSHALDLNRVAYSRFDSAIYTNLTPDHLELHKDMDHYFEAKAKLFQMTSRTNIINRDDAYGKRLIHRSLQRTDIETLTYGLTPEADIFATDIKYLPDYTEYKVVTTSGTFEVKVNIPGEIYVYNSLAAVAWAYSEGMSFDAIASGIQALEGVKGRFETVYNSHERKVVIDFAHTEDGLLKALQTLKPFVKGRLMLVFGVYSAPGALGLDKRIGMGEVAAKHADYAYVTSDNPKEQDPVAIIDDVITAMLKISKQHEAIVDRKTAIEKALGDMKAGDVLLISGKGHETAQVIGKVEVPFNEKEIVQTKMSLLFKDK